MKKSIKRLHLNANDLTPSNRIPLTNYVDDNGNEVYEKLVVADPKYCFYLFCSNYSLPEKCFSKGYGFIAQRPCYFIRLDEFEFPTIIFMLRRIDGIESFILMKDGSEVFNKAQVIYAFNKDDFKERFNDIAIDEKCSRCEFYYPAKYDKHLNDFIYEHVKSLKQMKPGCMPVDNNNFNEPYRFLWDWYPSRKNVEEPRPFVMLSPKSRLYDNFVREPSPVKSSPPRESRITRKLHLELSDDDDDDDFEFTDNREVSKRIPRFKHDRKLYQREVIKNNIAKKEKDRQERTMYERQLRNRERDMQMDSFTSSTETSSMIQNDSRYFSPIRPSTKPPPPQPPIKERKQRKAFADSPVDNENATFFFDSPPTDSYNTSIERTSSNSSYLKLKMPKYKK